MNEKAELLYTRIWWRTIKRFSDIQSFRNLIRVSFPHVRDYSTLWYRNFVHSLAFDRQYEKIFLDKEGFFKIVGGIETFATLLAEQEVNSYQTVIDSVSMVLAHSALDAAAFDYFTVIELIAPITGLELFVIKKQIILEELREKTYDDVVKEKIHDFVNELERKSLLYKIDKIFQICQPPPKYSPIDGHTFNRSKIEKLDTIRHEIVHGTGISGPLSDCGEDIKYMQDTANFLMALVNYKYDIKLNPSYAAISPAEDIKRN